MPKLSPNLAKVRAGKLVKGLKRHGGNMSALAREEGRTPQAVSDQFKKPYVKNVMAKMLEDVGVTDRYLANTIKNGLKATKLVYVDSSQLTKTGAPKKVEETVDDWQARHKFVETSCKIKGHMKPETVIEDNSINFGDIPAKGPALEVIKAFTNRLSARV